MHPIDFRYSTKVLRPPIMQKYSDDVTEIGSLPVWTDGKQCVSCWQMSLRERMSALLFGRVWLGVLSGQTQPPIFAVVSKKFLAEQPRDGIRARSFWKRVGLFGVLGFKGKR